MNAPQTLRDLVVAAKDSRATSARPGRPPRQEYLRAIAPRMYRGTPGGTGKLTSYGLKMHPARATKVAYPWVATL